MANLKEIKHPRPCAFLHNWIYLDGELTRYCKRCGKNQITVADDPQGTNPRWKTTGYFE